MVAPAWMRFLSPGSRRALQVFPDAEKTESRLFCPSRAFPGGTNADTVIMSVNNILALFPHGNKHFFSWAPGKVHEKPVAFANPACAFSLFIPLKTGR
jgi:hypothetical protein